LFTDDDGQDAESDTLLGVDPEKNAYQESQLGIEESPLPRKSHWQQCIDVLWMLLNVFSTVVIVFLNKM
jgi:hypothetical protein